MEFTFQTRYDTKALTVMARALRKTIRKKHSRRSHIFGWIVFALTALLVVSGGLTLDRQTVVTAAVALVLLLALLFEDRINGYIAKKRLLAGTEEAETVFTEEGFVSTTEVGRTEWKYDKILLVAETADFFVFVFSFSHAQLYDKHRLQGGSAEDFRRFIEKAAGKQVQSIK